MVGQPVQQGGRHLGVAEHAGPLGEVQVRRDHDAGVLVQAREQVKQRRPAGLAERQVAQFVQDHQVHAQQARGDAAGATMRFLLLQGVDQVHRR